MGTEKRFRNLYVSGTLRANKTLTASSNVTVTGTLTASAASKVPVQTVSSTATTVNAYGITMIVGASSALTFKLGDPAAGYQKTIVCKTHTGTTAIGARIKVNTTTDRIYSSSAPTLAKSVVFYSSGASAILTALNSSEWIINSLRGAVLASSS